MYERNAKFVKAEASSGLFILLQILVTNRGWSFLADIHADSRDICSGIYWQFARQRASFNRIGDEMVSGPLSLLVL